MAPIPKAVLIEQAERLFGIQPYIAKGALDAAPATMEIDAAQAWIEDWLGHAVGNPAPGGGGGGDPVPVDTPPQVIYIDTGDTIADLDPDGAPTALVRHGTALEIPISLGDDGTWRQASDPHVMIHQADTWGMDLLNHSLASIRNAYMRFSNPLTYSFPARSYLTVAAGSGANTLTLNSAAAFAASGNMRVTLGQVIAWTGKVGNQLTGVTGVSIGLPQNTLMVSGVTVGGWGTSVVPLDRVDEMYAAGFTLETMATAFMNGSFDHKAMSVAPYYSHMNAGESYGELVLTPTGGLGMGTAIVSDPDDYATVRDGERQFHQMFQDWTALPVTPAKRFLHASMFGKMNDAAANDTGEVYAYTLRLRYVGTP